MDLNGAIFRINNVLPEEEFGFLQNYAHDLAFEGNKSFVYNFQTRKKEMNNEARKSETVYVKEESLLDFIEDKFIKPLSDQNTNYKFNLIRNPVSFIRYKEGGYFDWHHDVQHITVNGGRSGIKEMHLIFCIDRPDEGGHLKIIDLENNELTIEESITPNSLVVFDKSLKHCGSMVKKGTRIIIGVDLIVSQIVSSKQVNEFLTQTEADLINMITTGKPEAVVIEHFGVLESVYKQISIRFPNLINEIIPFFQMHLDPCGYDEDYVDIDLIPNKVLWAKRVEEGGGACLLYYSNGKFYISQTADEKNLLPYKEGVDEDEFYPEFVSLIKEFEKEKEDLLSHVNTFLRNGGGRGIDDFTGDFCTVPGLMNLNLPKNLKTVNSLPKSISGGWANTSIEGDHGPCGDVGYNPIQPVELNYRFGLMKYSPELEKPSCADELPEYGVQVFRELCETELPDHIWTSVEKYLLDGIEYREGYW